MPKKLRFEGEVPDKLFDEQFREEGFLQGLLPSCKAVFVR